MTSQKPSFIKKLFNLGKSLFVSGVLALLPLALTLSIFAFLFKTTQAWLNPIYNLLPEALKAIPGVEFVVVFAVIIAIGTIIKSFILRKLIDLFEWILGQVPLLKHVYFGIKQLLNAFGPKDDEHFKQVVLVEFPRRGSYSIGFVTNESSLHSPQKEAAEPEKRYFNVFVPHTPNPTTGFFIFVPSDECTPLDISRQEAMTLIISGGIIQPENWKK